MKANANKVCALSSKYRHPNKKTTVGSSGDGGTFLMVAGARRHLTCASRLPHEFEEEIAMSVYKVIELIGTSPNSWEEAAKNAVERAAESLRELRVAEVVSQDLVITDGKVEAYRAKVSVSFKFEGSH